MPIRGKSINLFLMDGTASGRIKCTLANWTGVAYKIPKILLDKCNEIKYLKQSGVYFLFGTDSDENPAVYIGQAGVRKNKEGLLYRIKEPHNSIDYWTEAVMFTTTNDSFGPTEISYLENRFCNLALAANRYKVKNANDPNPGNLTEEKESEMEEFIDYAKIVMGTLGHRIFVPYITPDSSADDNEPILYFAKASCPAKGQRTSEGFVVLKGSTISQQTVKSCPESAIRDRKKFADKIGADYILTKDILFGSPSAAAAFVGGSSLSGNELWKTIEGVPLKDLDCK
ncbi:MAG: GIY-YIG nuclease family protein [Anaerovoracaceae bacterium]